MSNQITKSDKTLRALITSDAAKAQISTAMPSYLSPDIFIRVTLTTLNKTPKLQKCTQGSFTECLLDLASMGIVPDGRQAHLIPYGTTCKVMVGFQGFLDMVRRDENVSDVEVFTIRENDTATFHNGELDHSFNAVAERGEVVGTYTRISWIDGTKRCGEPFLKEDAEKARASSQSGNSGPWKDHYVEMWKKSNIRRDSKMWPLSPETLDKIRKSDELDPIRNITPDHKPKPETSIANLENLIEETEVVEEVEEEASDE